MTAQEMFQELGYEYKGEIITYNSEWEPITALYYFKDNRSGIRIWFNLDNKVFMTSNLSGTMAVEVDMKIYQAITQQMKELGWLDVRT